MKKIFNLIVFFTLLSLNAQNTVAEKLIYNKSKIAIFPKEYKNYLVDSTFTPTIEEITKAETALIKRIKTININRPNQSNSPIIDKNLKKYNRQYFGNYDSLGNKLLLINFIWDKDSASNDWLNEYITILDGGSYFWTIKYNVLDDTFYEFNVKRLFIKTNVQHRISVIAVELPLVILIRVYEIISKFKVNSNRAAITQIRKTLAVILKQDYAKTTLYKSRTLFKPIFKNLCTIF